MSAESPQAFDTATPAPAPQAAHPAPTTTSVTVAPPPRRRRARMLMLSVPLALAAAGAWVWFGGGRFEETENANLHQARVLVASELSGRVTEVGAADNAAVAKGDVLFRLDEEPWRIALQQADAAVAAARVQVAQLQSAYAAAVTQRDLARADLAYQEAEAARQAALGRKGVTAAAALDESRRDLQRAQQGLAAAEVGVAGAIAALGGQPDAPIDSHPLVVQALAARDKAAYTLSQAVVRAPEDGVVTQAASFKAGQFVAAGSPLFSLIVTGDAWVDANFKETQLEGIAPGQPAEVVFDAYPDRPFAASVEAVGAGTGAEFSLLPAQNATGNWVKVTQRVPVRLRLDGDQDLADLRSGMSATVSVDTGRETGLERLGNRAAEVEASTAGWIEARRK